MARFCIFAVCCLDLHFWDTVALIHTTRWGPVVCVAREETSIQCNSGRVEKNTTLEPGNIFSILFGAGNHGAGRWGKICNASFSQLFKKMLFATTKRSKPFSWPPPNLPLLAASNGNDPVWEVHWIGPNGERAVCVCVCVGGEAETQRKEKTLRRRGHLATPSHPVGPVPARVVSADPRTGEIAGKK